MLAGRNFSSSASRSWRFSDSKASRSCRAMRRALTSCAIIPATIRSSCSLSWSSSKLCRARSTASVPTTSRPTRTGTQMKLISCIWLASRG